MWIRNNWIYEQNEEDVMRLAMDAEGPGTFAPIRPVSVNYCQFFHRIAK